MKLTLTRDELGDSYTYGVLKFDSGEVFQTIEDKDRKLESGGVKVKNETAIPRGTYKIIINHSNRFNKELPLLIDVPQFVGVRIHSGNTSKDTEGCVIVGKSRGTLSGAKAVLNSRAAMSEFMKKLDVAYDAGDHITIEVK